LILGGLALILARSCGRWAGLPKRWQGKHCYQQRGQNTILHFTSSGVGELSWELHSSTPLAGVAHFEINPIQLLQAVAGPMLQATCLNSRRQLRCAHPPSGRTGSMPNRTKAKSLDNNDIVISGRTE
jgi:hypothetical protein